MEICKVCGKEYKAMTSMHTLTHGLTLKQYAELDETKPESTFKELDMSDPKAGDAVTVDLATELKKSKTDTIFDGKDRKYADRPLSDFLKKYNISEKDLTSLALKYTTGSILPISQQIEKKIKVGEDGAAKVAGPEEVQVYTIAEADALAKKHGYECLECRRVNGKKVWFMRKQ